MRRIAKYKRFIEQMISQLEGYDPLNEEILFEEFDEDKFEESLEEEDIEDDDNDGSKNGGMVWTS